MFNDDTVIEASFIQKESRQRLEDRMYHMLYSKPLSFVKKLTRRINN